METNKAKPNKELEYEVIRAKPYEVYNPKKHIDDLRDSILKELAMKINSLCMNTIVKLSDNDVNILGVSFTKQLGLQPFGEPPYTLATGCGVRRTGRTTHMLITACVYIQQGYTVILSTHDSYYSKQLYYKLMEYCERLGITTSLNQVIYTTREYAENASKHRKNVRVFTDHYAYYG